MLLEISTTSFVKLIESIIEIVDDVIQKEEKGEVSKFTKTRTIERFMEAGLDMNYISDYYYTFNAFTESEYLEMIHIAYALGFTVTPSKKDINFPRFVSFSFSEPSFGVVEDRYDGFPPYSHSESQKRFKTFKSNTKRLCESYGIELGVSRNV
jgi:hypothetical protein